MRVIAGLYKGRKLVAPKGDTRPTLDRTKETLFNILAPRLRDAFFVDLFAGSGQIAIEALSRGATEVLLCDSDRFAKLAIEENFAKIGVRPRLMCCDYKHCLDSVAPKTVDVMFVDPPYLSGVYESVLEIVCKKDLLAKDGIVVCEHLANMSLPSKIGNLSVYDCRKIGTVMFTFYSAE